MDRAQKNLMTRGKPSQAGRDSLGVLVKIVQSNRTNRVDSRGWMDKIDVVVLVSKL